MKKLALSLAAAAALAVSLPALAQQTAPGAARTPIPKGVFLRGQTATQYLARDRLIGAKVHNRQGRIIGDIEDLIVGQNNQIEGVIMGVGGFLGAGEKKVGVRYSALQFGSDGKVSLPLVTKEVLDALESYKRAQPKRRLIDRAKEKAQELTDKTIDTSKDAAETAREKAGPALEKAREASREAYEKAKEAYEKAKQAVQQKQ